MKKKSERITDLTKLTEEELLKYEIAKELGLYDQVMNQGWKSLTSKETGRIGGMVAKRKESLKNNKNITNIN